MSPRPAASPTVRGTDAMSPVDTRHLEDLEPVGARPLRALAGPRVGERLLAALCGDPQAGESGDLDAAEHAALVDLGWLEPDGEPTARTQELRGDLQESRTAITLVAHDRQGTRRGWVCAGLGQAVIGLEVEPVAPGLDAHAAPRADLTFDVVPVSSLPLALARWGGLVPTWNYDSTHELGEPAALDARVADAHAQVPDGADEGLRDLWGREWTRWTVQVPQQGVTLEYLAIAGAGQYVVRRRADGATVLAPRPGSLVWGDLQKLVLDLPGQRDEDAEDASDW